MKDILKGALFGLVFMASLIGVLLAPANAKTSSIAVGQCGQIELTNATGSHIKTNGNGNALTLGTGTNWCVQSANGIFKFKVKGTSNCMTESGAQVIENPCSSGNDAQTWVLTQNTGTKDFWSGNDINFVYTNFSTFGSVVRDSANGGNWTNWKFVCTSSC